jgi:hypothetical protein
MISKGRNTVTLRELLEKVTEPQILYHYLGIYTFPILVKSPLRKDDNPSFSYTLSREGKVYFNDFASGERGDIIDLLGKMWNTSLGDTVCRIYNDIPNFSGHETFVTSYDNGGIGKMHFIQKKRTFIRSHIRNWESRDTEYWESYGITKEWAHFGNIYPISHIVITDDKNNTLKFWKAEKIAYTYVERKDGIVTQKIYQPFSKREKWLNNHDKSVWDLWRQLPEKGDILIITSSRKDALCIWSNTGYPSCSLQGEGYLPKESVITELKERFSNIFVLYDNDYTSEVNHGHIFGKNMADTFNLIQLELDKKYQAKDSSDFVKKNGRKLFHDTLVSMINSKLHNSNN